MADTDKARVFHRFVRLDHRRASGSGLGLSIIRAVARAHGGDVTVRDGAGGVGARFELRLPVMVDPDRRTNDNARVPSRGGAR
ncbi:MAG: ATP-binding protein [Lapillicoccus sp.]